MRAHGGQTWGSANPAFHVTMPVPKWTVDQRHERIPSTSFWADDGRGSENWGKRPQALVVPRLPGTGPGDAEFLWS